MGPISMLLRVLQGRQGSKIRTKLFEHEGSSPKEVARLVAVDIPLVPASAFLPGGSSLYSLIEQALQHHNRITEVVSPKRILYRDMMTLMPINKRG